MSIFNFPKKTESEEEKEEKEREREEEERKVKEEKDLSLFGKEKKYVGSNDIRNWINDRSNLEGIKGLGKLGDKVNRENLGKELMGKTKQGFLGKETMRKEIIALEKELRRSGISYKEKEIIKQKLELYKRAYQSLN